MIKKGKFTVKNIDRWYPFFSQTGTEIMEIIAYTGIIPEKIITNLDPSDADKVNKVLFETFSDRIYFLPNRPRFEEYNTIIGKAKGALITLHGWLRIVPKDVCRKYKIYNGHPGLITKYPELKGKDPQIRAFMGNYDTGGSVVHEVIPKVDEGKILISKEVSLEGYDLNDTFRILTKASLDTWIEFFDNVEGSINND